MHCYECSSKQLFNRPSSGLRVMDEILTGLGLDGTGGTDILLKIKIESNSHVFLFIILKKTGGLVFIWSLDCIFIKEKQESRPTIVLAPPREDFER